MSALTALLALGASDAWATTKDVTVCVKVRTNYEDGGGDFWATNDFRPARGLHVNAAGNEHVLDFDGCKVITITAGSIWYLTMRSEATVSGIHLVSYTQTATSYALHSVATAFSIADPSVTVYLAPHQTWNNLMVGVYAMSRNTFNLGTHSARGCCHPGSGGGGVTNGGLCGLFNSNDYGPWPGDDPLEIQFFNDTSDPTCCGSSWDPPGAAGERPAVQAQNPWKWATAHELGHTIVMERMGRRERTHFGARLGEIWIPVNNGANQCMGSFAYWDLDEGFVGPDPTNTGIDEPIWSTSFAEYPDGRHDFDLAPDHRKSNLSMEYASGAAREGWADFFAAWLWNKRVESDCLLGVHANQDWDLDGDIDDNYGAQGVAYDDVNDDRDGSMDCEGAGPYAGYGEPVTSDPVAGTITARDWLGDVVGAGLCIAPNGINNRHTQHDWARYWWDMTTDEGVMPEVLADIHVDMCPTNWALTTATNDTQVHRRITLSTSFHGEAAAHTNQKSNGVDR